MWKHSIGYATFYPLHLANYLVCPKDHHMNWGTHYQLRGMASTLRMRTAISPRLWQPRSFSYIHKSSKWWQKNKQTRVKCYPENPWAYCCSKANCQQPDPNYPDGKEYPSCQKIAFPSRKHRVCTWNKSKLIFGLHPATSKLLKKQCKLKY